jgi:hypothetical protein
MNTVTSKWGKTITVGQVGHYTTGNSNVENVQVTVTGFTPSGRFFKVTDGTTRFDGWLFNVSDQIVKGSVWGRCKVII